MVDKFEVEPIFEARQHERHQFKLVIEGKKFKGDYTDGEIKWLNPHPKQVISEEELESVEAEVHRLLDQQGVRDETDEMEVEPLLKKQASNMQMFKLKINGEEFKGTFHNGEIDWFHPKPRRKLDDERVEKVEKKVYDEMKSHIDTDSSEK